MYYSEIELYTVQLYFPVNNHFFSHHKTHNTISNGLANLHRKCDSMFEIYLLG